MKKIIVNGGNRLIGEINISGAKNAALPIMISTLLCKEKVVLKNIPNLADITTLIYLLNYLGVKTTLNGVESNTGLGKVIEFDASNLKTHIAPESIVSTMRASFIVMGPLLARFGEAKVALPGGCAIGSRPVDIHLQAFEKMGVEIKIEEGYVISKAKYGKLHGADINFRFPSVGATQNVMMGAVLAVGDTKIVNAAREPEIVDLANCLNAMGAKIKGAGTSTIEIEGVEELHSAEHIIIGDRIEAASYMIAGLMTDGDLTLNGLDFENTLGDLIDKLKQIGAEIEIIDKETLEIRRGEEKLKPINITTAVYPGFPTDIQAQIMVLLAGIDGESIVDETIFENRFMHVPELNKMNTNIEVQEGNKALVHGQENCFKPAIVVASDLRASMSLILAALCADGESQIEKIHHLERGYEFLADKLNNCGADIKVVYAE